MQTYLVGGAVRDEIMGLRSKDLDYSVVLDEEDMVGRTDPFSVMRELLVAKGYFIYTESPQFFTIRAKAPNGDDADFVLARKEGGYGDGRRPDAVEPGTLLDDLARRDFTMNAMAKASDGTLIDPFGGQEDIRNGLIRCVGNPFDRILKEDPLRGLRAMRFSITKEFEINQQILGVLKSRHFAEQIVKTTKAERVREELEKMFAANTLDSVMLLTELGLVGTLFNNQTGIRLMPTTKG